MTLTQQAIIAMVQRDALALANELADKTDYEAAGYVLRVGLMVRDIQGDEGLVRVIRNLLDETRNCSQFTWAKQRIAKFRETFDYAVSQMKVAA